ncbi:MAG: hypothetical protein E7050_11000 [Lentisphaerae bacterium]|nr:hypothetical protein [Lentisphaerota bacterium]
MKGDRRICRFQTVGQTGHRYSYRLRRKW